MLFLKQTNISDVTLVKMRNGVSYLVYMYTLGAGRILIKSNIIVGLLNLMSWKASWIHRTSVNEKKIMIKLKKFGPNDERLWSHRDGKLL